MPNTQAIGVAYADPEFQSVTVTGEATAADLYASDELGYTSAAQGAVTQLTNKSTGVTLDKSMGRITMNNALLAGGASVTFTLTNNKIGANDVVTVSVSGGGTVGAYWPFVASQTTGSAVIGLYNNTGGNLSEAVILNFCVIHGLS